MKTWLASITLFVLLLLILCGGAGWLLYSESGANWLLTRLGTATGLRIASIEGTLLGKLRLSELQLEHAETTFTCDSIELDSRLDRLYPLLLNIERLQISGLTLANQPSASSSQPLKLSWPELPWWAGLLEIELQRLSVTEVHLQQDDADQQLEQLTLSGRWREHQLQLTAFELRTPDLGLRGAMNASFDHPALQLELQADNRHQHQPWQRLLLRGTLGAADRLLLRGPVSVSLADSAGALLSAEGELGLAEEALLFEKIQLKSGRRKGSLLASGQLNFSSSEVGLSSRLKLKELDLQPELGKPLRLSGEVELTGNLASYRGRFSIHSRAEQPFAARVAGKFSGDRQQLLLSDLTGDWLQGQLSGKLQADWQQGWRVSGQLDARQLDPGKLHDRLEGTLGFHLAGEIGDSGQGQDGQLSLTLNETNLQQQPLSGQLELKIEQGQYIISNLDLQGIGFKLQGHGSLAERIELSWQIDQLQQLLTDVQGRLSGTGQLQLAAEGINADFSSRGAGLQYDNLLLDNWQLQGQLVASEQVQLTFAGQNLQPPQAGLALRDLRLAVRGTVSQHTVDFRFERTGSSLSGELSGGWNDQQWQGDINQLLLDDERLGVWQTSEAISLQLSKQLLQLGQLQLAGPGGSLRLQGSYLLAEQQGSGQLDWQSIDLSLFNPWLSGLTLTGISSGNVVLQHQDPARLQAQLTWQGEITTPRQTFTLSRGELQSDWGELGLQSRLSLQLEDGSRFDVELGNEEKFAFREPQQLRLQLRGENLALQRAQPWLPAGLDLTGLLNLQSDGHWDAGQPWQLSGLAELSGARLSWQEDEELISANLTTGRLLWQWHEQLSGQLELQFAKRGSIEGNLRLPLAAALPLEIAPQQPLNGELSAQLQELGLFSVLFPGRVQESSGQLNLDLRLAGIWQQPLLQGDVRLFDGRAYLPRPGILLHDIELLGRFDEQRFTLSSAQVRSGEGELSGTGNVQLANWQPQRYQLELTGSNFQLFNLSELQVEVSPELTIDGDLKQVTVKGSLQIPKLMASGQQKNNQAENSPDLVIVDAPQKITKSPRIQPHLDLTLQLGENVFFKTAGIDAQLEGNLRIQSTAQQALAAFGKISVAKGRYASYGVSLDISRGNLIFNGGPFTQPLLDILALRTAGEVKAGVQVSGTPKRPTVKLYSEPSLPETDILSYIVLGRPVDAQGSQSSVLLSAAGALLSQGESVVLQEKLKSKLGLDVLDISAGDGDTTSSVITTGKYLRPNLYVSFGYSLFNNSNEVKLRYSLSPRWEMESNFGTQSGADLFYKIDIP